MNKTLPLEEGTMGLEPTPVVLKLRTEDKEPNHYVIHTTKTWINI